MNPLAANFHGLTLVIPDQGDVERDAVARAWQQGGGSVVRVGRFWDPPGLERNSVRIYGNDTFALVLAQKLGLDLLSPPDDLLMKVAGQWTKRSIAVIPLADAGGLSYPAFVKPVVPKLFRASVYASSDALRDECRGLEEDAQLYVSDVVTLTAEMGSFVLCGKVMAKCVYEGTAPDETVREAEQFLGAFVTAEASKLPRTCVLDIGLIPERGWALVEANASWGAGLNGCDPHGAALCIAVATSPT